MYPYPIPGSAASPASTVRGHEQRQPPPQHARALPPPPPPRRSTHTLACPHPTLPSVRSQPVQQLLSRQSRVALPDMSFSTKHHRSGLAHHRSFAHPPMNPAGDLCDASDRPLLCLSLSQDEEEMVVGSADHALYAYSLKTGKPTRKLYSKAHGHIDWVSCVAHTDNGQVLSGGGDGKVCLWPAARPSSSSSSSSFLLRGGGATAGMGGRAGAGNSSLTACQDFDGHASAVSKVLPVPDSNVAFSGGYDGLIKLWNVKTKKGMTFDAGGANRTVAVTDNSPGSLSAMDPVMDFCFDSDKEQLVSGTRKGTCNVWDLPTAKHVGALKAAHRGPVSCVKRWSSSVIVTGGQDGTVKILDTRRGMPLVAHKVTCHVDPTKGTTGAVACLEKAGGLLATGGADKRVCLLDPRMNFQPLHVFTHHRAPVSSLKYALAAECPVLFSGAGDGMVHCVNLLSRAVLYGLHPTQGAVRAIATTTHLQADKKLVVAGEDGEAVVFKF